MAEESIGTYRVDIIANAGDLEAEVKRTKTLVQSMGTDFEKSFSQMSRSQQKATIAALRYEQRLGKTREEIKLLSLAAGGAAPEAIEKLRQKLLQAREATTGGAAQLDRYGMSAKQTSAAMRGVPAQITDIVTSLQGGQRPMTVLLQQGGQLKDMFGGIVPAARALGSAVLSMVNPFTLAAAGAAALTAAWISGSKESEHYAQSLAITGNYAGLTTDQMGAMAERIGTATGTVGKAADALTKIVSTGRFTGDVIEDIGRAALEMEKATGQAVDKTIDQFEELGKSPADAILKLNDQYHFLTASVYAQITALEDQNQKDEAAALAQRTFAAAVQQRAEDVRAAAGYLERAWNSVAGAAKGAWDAMMGVGRPSTVADIIAAGEASIARYEQTLRSLGLAATATEADLSRTFLSGSDRKAATEAIRQIENIRKQLTNVRQKAADDERKAKEKADAQQLEDEKTAATQRLNAQKKAMRDRKQLRDAELEQMRADAKLLGLKDQEIADREKAILAKYKDPKGSASGPRDDAATKLLQQLRQRASATEAQLASEQKLTTAQQERAKYEQLFADLKTKQVLTADQKSLLVNESAIRAQLDKNVALEQEIRAKKEAAQIDSMRLSLSASLTADARQYAEQLSGVGLGKQAQDELRAQQRLVRDYQRDLKRASQSMLEGTLSKQAYDEQIGLLQDNLDARLALQHQYYDDVRAAQENWRNGATSSLADYLDAARNVADSTGQLFSNAFKGMEDALVTFVTTGKLSFKDLADSIIADMVRIAVQQNITGPLAGALGSLFSSSAPAGVTPGVDWTFSKSAKGNVYDSASLSRYTNGVYDKPQLFAFAKGAGVFAEAGPEAIMPLKRGADGSLGVRAQMPAAGDVVVNITNQGQPVTTAGQPQVSRDAMGRMVIDVMIKDAQTNGAYMRQLKGALR